MKKLLLPILSLAAFPAFAQTPVSKGVYRLPYADNTAITITNDHVTHPASRNRLDMNADEAGATIVAAAAGIVRIIVDNNDTACLRTPSGALSAFDTDTSGRVENDELQAAFNTPNPIIRTQNRLIIRNAFATQCTNYDEIAANCCVRSVTAINQTCQWMGAPAGAVCGDGDDGDGPNNYVWVEHPNGEWSKYSHIRRGTATIANRRPPETPLVNGQRQVLSIGMSIPAGYPIGIEGDVGNVTGPHLHFEIAGIDDTSQIRADGFLVTDPADSAANRNLRNRVPVFCQLGVVKNGDTIETAKCADSCESKSLFFTGSVTPATSPRFAQVSETANSTASVGANSGLVLRAGERVTLKPGFSTTNAGFFAAEIGACDAPGGTGDG